MVADPLASRHDLLTVDLDRLHLLTTSSDDALPEPRMRAVVVRDLLDLRALLEHHFSVEEGLIAGSALARDSGEHASLASMFGDHRRILTELRHLAAQASDLPIDVIKLRISDLLDSLGEHERAEAAILPAQRVVAP